SRPYPSGSRRDRTSGSPEQSVCRDHRQQAHLRLTAETSFGDRRLKQFGRISGWVIDDDLFSANAGYELISKVCAGCTKAGYGRLETGDFNRESIPPARNLPSSIRHRLSAACRRIRRAEHETQVASRQHRECWRRMHVFVESVMLAIEGNGRVNVVDVVKDLSGANRAGPS